ncbi:MAG: hypothetical protein AAF591_16495 [Verrucomicrobiota bacterium]
MFTSAFKKLFSSGQDAKKRKKKKTKSPKVDATQSPEQLCGITSSMSPDEVKEHLALLYRRHNRAASSLDDTLRSEAEIMLDAIVACREKYLSK